MTVKSHYPDCGHQKYKLIFNQSFQPREEIPHRIISILWTSSSAVRENFKYFVPNHIVPLCPKPMNKNQRKKKKFC